MLKTAAVPRLTLLCVMLVATVGIVTPAAQSDPFAGRWAASEPDRGVVVMLSIDAASTLVLPGTGPSGRTEAMTLVVRNLNRQPASATFSVDLPDNEGTVDLEFRIVATEGVGVLRVLKIDGEPADDETPTWTLRRQRERSSSEFLRASGVMLSACASASSSPLCSSPRRRPSISHSSHRASIY